jgi:hypothetical protein
MGDCFIPKGRDAFAQRISEEPGVVQAMMLQMRRTTSGVGGVSAPHKCDGRHILFRVCCSIITQCYA